MIGPHVGLQQPPTMSFSTQEHWNLDLPDTLPYLLDLLQSYTFNSSNKTMTQPAARSRRETNQVRG